MNSEIFMLSCRFRLSICIKVVHFVFELTIIRKTLNLKCISVSLSLSLYQRLLCKGAVRNTGGCEGGSAYCCV
jgi:hypothetical protein